MAVIPARGGSKRIPRKNVRKFAGRPMIVHSLLAARASRLFDRIIVSTDDAEIAGVARESGGEVPFMRPAAISDDLTSTERVVQHAIQWLADEGVVPRAVCCIYATAPFIESADLCAGAELLESDRWQFVFAATSYGFPIFRSFEQLESGGLAMFFPQNFAKRSQDLPEALHDAGQFYWGTPYAWSGAMDYFGERSTVVRIPRWRVQDIDTDEDWRRAEAMAAYLRQ